MNARERFLACMRFEPMDRALKGALVLGRAAIGAAYGRPRRNLVGARVAKTAKGGEPLHRHAEVSVEDVHIVAALGQDHGRADHVTALIPSAPWRAVGEGERHRR